MASLAPELKFHSEDLSLKLMSKQYEGYEENKHCYQWPKRFSFEQYQKITSFFILYT